MHKRPAAGVTAIHHIQIDKLPKRVHDIILQSLSTNSNTPLRFEFAQIKNRKMLSF